MIHPPRGPSLSSPSPSSSRHLSPLVSLATPSQRQNTSSARQIGSIISSLRQQKLSWLRGTPKHLSANQQSIALENLCHKEGREGGGRNSRASRFHSTALRGGRSGRPHGRGRAGVWPRLPEGGREGERELARSALPIGLTEAPIVPQMLVGKMRCTIQQTSDRLNCLSGRNVTQLGKLGAIWSIGVIWLESANLRD